jgi:hypothetical protein
VWEALAERDVGVPWAEAAGDKVDVDVMNDDVCFLGRGRTARPGVPEDEDGALRASLVYGTVTAVGASVSIVVMVFFTLSLCWSFAQD